MLAPGQVGIEGRFLQRGADRGPHRGSFADDVVTGYLGLPSVGGSSVVSMWTVVDLPAPLGPRKP